MLPDPTGLQMYDGQEAFMRILLLWLNQDPVSLAPMTEAEKHQSNIALSRWYHAMRGTVGGGTLVTPPGWPPAAGDISAVNVTAPVTGGGASGAVTIGVNEFTGDSGSGGLSGVVPAPVAGDAAKFLRGDKTWAAPAGMASIESKMMVAEAGDFDITTSETTFDITSLSVNNIGGDVDGSNRLGFPYAGKYMLFLTGRGGGSGTHINFGLWYDSGSFAVYQGSAPVFTEYQFAFCVPGFVSVDVGGNVRRYRLRMLATGANISLLGVQLHCVYLGT